MTLPRFVAKNAFRNRRRSVLTLLSIGVSLLLLTLLITVWQILYGNHESAAGATRLVVRHRVSLSNFLPAYYEDKIRAIPGVVTVTTWNWFGGQYKDDRPENMFMQFGTQPKNLFDVFQPDWQLPPDQLQAWQRDRAGAVISQQLAEKHGFKIGDRIHIDPKMGYPVPLDLTIRGVFTTNQKFEALLFDFTNVEEALPRIKGQTGTFYVRVDRPESTGPVARAIDDMFRNSPQPTKTETENAFRLAFVSMLGNVKAFILSICMAVVFAILLVSANTMAMSIRERVREVAVLKTLGFTRGTILSLFVGEAVTLALAGGLLGSLMAKLFIGLLAASPIGFWFQNASVGAGTLLFALAVAALVGFASSFLPSWRAAQLNIVEGLRYVG